jgi:O-antigen/teichoic acid export membrane protein
MSYMQISEDERPSSQESFSSAPSLRMVVPDERLQDAGVLAKGLSVSLTGGMAAQAIGMFGQILMARLLGAAEFGLYSVGWTLVRLLSTVTTLGLESGVTYFGARYLRFSPARLKGVVLESIAFTGLCGTTIAATLYLAAPAIAQHIFHKPEVSVVIRAFAPAFPLYGVLIVAAAVTRLSHRMQYVMYSGVALTGTALIFFCISFMLGFGLKGAVFSTVGGIGIATLVAGCFARSLFPQAFAKGVRSKWVGQELMAYSFPLVLSGLAGAGLTFADRLFVASFCTSADMGVYQAASQVAIVFSIAHGAFDNIFAPMVADLHARGEKTRLAELYKVSTKWGLCAGIPIFLVIFFARREVVELAYGSPYIRATTPLLILSVGRIFMMTTSASGPMLLMTGGQKLYVALPLLVVPIDLLLNYLLVPSYGLAGAAAAAAISAMILNAAATAAVGMTLGVWPFDTRYIKLAIAACVASSALVLAPLQYGVPAVRLLVVSGVCFAAFGGCLVGLGLDAEDREFLNTLRRHASRAMKSRGPVHTL